MPKAVEKKPTEDLKEFTGSDHQNVTADPHVGPSAARGADKSGGEKEIPDFATRAEVINQILGSIHTMNKGQLQDIYKGLHAPTDPGRAADKGQDHGEREPLYLSPTSVRPVHGDLLGYGHPTKSSVTRPGSEQNASDMRLAPTSVVAKEDIDEVFGEELSEELKEKALTVFEAVINTKLTAELIRISEENEAWLNETVEEIRKELTEQTNEYITYIAEEWVKENKIEVQSAIKAEMADNFLTALKQLFEDNYINVFEESVDVVAEMQERLEAAENKLNEVTAELLAAREENDEHAVREAFTEATQGLNEFQIDKLATLSEGIAWENPEEFVSKLNVLKETYMSDKPAKGADILTEENGVEGEESVKTSDPAMKAYLAVADQASKNKK